MARIHLEGAGDTVKLFDRVVDDICENVGGQLIEKSQKDINDVKVLIMVFDKYYLRSSTQVTATVVMVNVDDYVDVEIITAGAGDDVVFNFASSSEDSYGEEIAEVFKEKGYQIIKERT